MLLFWVTYGFEVPVTPEIAMIDIPLMVWAEPQPERAD